LSVARGNGSGPLIKCHAGCATADVLAALDLSWSDLLPPRGPRQPAAGKASRATAEARRAASDKSDSSASTGKTIISEYCIRDTAGDLVAVHVREDLPGGGKRFRWELPDGTLGLGGRPVSSLPLFGSERLKDLDPDQAVIVTEGEKVASVIVSAGIPAVGTVTGASGTPGDEALRPLLGRQVYLWPDNDPPGIEHMRRIAEALWRIGCRQIRTVNWEAAPPGGDAADLLALEGGLDEVHALLDEATPYTPGEAGLVTERLSDVTPEAVTWLWDGRLPLGKLVLIAGLPGLGKSCLSLAIASAVSRGSLWPCGEGRAPLGDVLLISLEDDPADTIVPRLLAEGADLSRIHRLAFVPGADGRRGLDLSRDVPRLETYLEAHPDIRLVVIDPLSAVLGAIDTHRNADVRGVLAPLADVAARHRVCVLGVTHLAKASSGQQALLRVIGSVAFAAAARAVYLVTRDATDESKVLFLPVKSNLGPVRPGLSFTRETVSVADRIEAPRIRWLGTVTVTADEAAPDSDSEPNALSEAVAFLRSALRDGPVEAKRLFADAQAAGIAAKTLRRAKTRLRIESGRSGGLGRAGTWEWRLLDQDDRER